MNKKFIAILSLAGLIGLFQLFTFSTVSDTSNNNLTENYKIIAPAINHNINFCGEKVPLYSSDIMERFDKEILKNSYWHSEMLLYYKRSGKYFPIIEPILKKHGIPEDFKYLAIIESGLSNVKSPAGAAGFWQIMSQTGKSYGLEVNKEIDERYNLVKATNVACEYIKESYDRFGSWTLVAASYNMGMNGLARRLKKQKTRNYYDLLLNSETSRYVFRILAIKDILTSPEKYGFNTKNTKKYDLTATKQIILDSTVKDLSDYSKKIKLNYKIVKLFNPWIKGNKITNSTKKKYIILIPTENHYVFNDVDTLKTDSSTLLIDSTSINANLKDSTAIIDSSNGENQFQLHQR